MSRTTFLHATAEAGSLARVRELLDAGEELDPQDHNGMTPLMLALCRGNEDVALELVERGARLDVVDTGGRNSFEWARPFPAILERMEARGGAPSFRASLETPHDRASFSPRFQSLLAELRGGGRFRVEPLAPIATAIRADMPDDLKALLHTWAHLPSAMIPMGGWWLMGSRLAGAPWWTERDPPDPGRVCFLADDSGELRLFAAWTDPDAPTELWEAFRGESPVRLGLLQDLGSPGADPTARARQTDRRAPRRDRALTLVPVSHDDLPADRLAPEVAYWAAPGASLVGGGGWVARNYFRLGHLQAVEIGPAVLDPRAGLRPVDLPSTVSKSTGLCAFHPGEPLGLLICQDLHIVDLLSATLRERVFASGDVFRAAVFVGAEHVAATTDSAAILLRRVDGDLGEVCRALLPFQPSRESPERAMALLAPREDGRTLLCWGKPAGGTTEVIAFAVDGDELVEVGRLGTGADQWAVRAGADVALAPRGGDAGWWRIDGFAGVLDELDRIAPRPALPPERLCLARVASSPPHPMCRPAALRAAGGAASGAWSWRGRAGFSFATRSETGTASPAPSVPEQRALIVGPGDEAAAPILATGERPLVATSFTFSFERAGERLLVVPEGQGRCYEVDARTARARVAVDRPGLVAAEWGADGVLLQTVDEVRYERLDAPGEASWRLGCEPDVSLVSVLHHRFLIAYRGVETPGIFLYLLTPAAPIPLGAAPLTMAMAWEDDDGIYLVDHLDRSKLARYRIHGLGEAAAPSRREPVVRLADPGLLETMPIPIVDLRRAADRSGR